MPQRPSSIHHVTIFKSVSVPSSLNFYRRRVLTQRESEKLSTSGVRVGSAEAHSRWGGKNISRQEPRTKNQTKSRQYTTDSICDHEPLQYLAMWDCTALHTAVEVPTICSIIFNSRSSGERKSERGSSYLSRQETHIAANKMSLDRHYSYSSMDEMGAKNTSMSDASSSLYPWACQASVEVSDGASLEQAGGLKCFFCLCWYLYFSEICRVAGWCGQLPWKTRSNY